MLNTFSSPSHESITKDQSIQIKDDIEIKDPFTAVKRKKKCETTKCNYICER